TRFDAYVFMLILANINYLIYSMYIKGLIGWIQNQLSRDRDERTLFSQRATFFGGGGGLTHRIFCRVAW
ncbi:hypothetical protein ACJX0J_033934, partial [Zea mays]